MNAELITHVFASLQNLEKCVANIKKMLPGQEKQSADILKVLPEQEKVVEQMRKVANKLQLDVAKNDWTGIVRLLKIFYGLNFMVRNDLLNELSQLSKSQTIQLVPAETPGKERVYH